MQIRSENLAQTAAADDEILCFAAIKQAFSALQFVSGKESVEEGKFFS